MLQKIVYLNLWFHLLAQIFYEKEMAYITLLKQI